MTAPVAPPPTPPRASWLRGTLLVFGGIVTVAALAFTTATVASALVRTTERATRTFTGTIERVEVVATGRVEISAGADDEVIARRGLTYGLSRPRTVERRTGGTLVLRATCPDALLGCNTTFRLTVPRATEVDVTANDSEISDLTGDVTVESNTGGVELNRLAGTLRLNVGAGAVVGTDLRSAEVIAGVGAGGVILDFAAAPQRVEARAGAGGVEISLPRGTESYAVDASAGAGETDVRVRTDPASPRTIRADAGAGSAIVRYGPG